MPTDQAAVCLDVGSTWTKAVRVRPDGGLAGFAEHPTTATDVPTGMDAAGAEMLMATEAGHRVACSAGAHVVHLHAGPLQHADLRTLRATRPTVLLLLGGYDGDDPADLLHNAGRLAGARVRFPIVLAAPEAVRDDA